MKQYKCVQVDHHNKISQAISEYISAGWIVHSYQAVCLSMTTNVRHYLLLEKEDSVSKVELEKYLTEEELQQLRTDSRNPTIDEAVRLRTKS